MKTIDEQLEDALARVKQLEADATAGSTLLSEAAKPSGDLKAQIVALTKEKDASPRTRKPSRSPTVS